jgi:hypothetical protein
MQNFAIGPNTIRKINAQMHASIAKYIQSYMMPPPEHEGVGYFEMATNDVAHNIQALQRFNQTLDLDRLEQDLYGQDTLPRDHFARVFDLIDTLREENFSFDDLK